MRTTSIKVVRTPARGGFLLECSAHHPGDKLKDIDQNSFLTVYVLWTLYIVLFILVY